MHPVGMPLFHRGVLLLRKAYGDKIEGNQMVREVQDFTDRGNAVSVRIKTGPHSAEADGMCGEKDVFSSGREILFLQCGVHAVEKPLFISAHHNGQRCTGGHFSVRESIRELYQQFTVINHDELPWLPVHCAGCTHGGMQQSCNLIVGHGCVLINPDADAPQDVHISFILQKLFRNGIADFHCSFFSGQIAFECNNPCIPFKPNSD